MMVLWFTGNCGGEKVAWRAVRCRAAESALVDGGPVDASVLVHTLKQLQHDIHPGDTMSAPTQQVLLHPDH